MNHLELVREATNQLGNQLTDVFDMAGVADGSDTERRAAQALSTIHNLLDDIPRVGRTASYVFEEGPMIYVNPGKDIREWNTSSGKKASGHNPRTAALSKTKSVTARGPILSRRVIPASLYGSLIEEAILTETKFELVVH